jgi:putative membrane protein
VTEIDPEDVPEAGLAAERTALAWDRSSLALLACGAAVVRGAPSVTGNPGRPWAGVVILALGLATWFAGRPLARLRAAAARRSGPVAASAHELAPLAVGAAAVGVGAAVLSLAVPG